MDTPLSREERRRLLLESLVDAAADAPAGEGSYDPRDLARRIRLGNDRGSPVARMVSWHESFHAFLNASTCHGNAMIFSGILTSSGFSRFEPLVRRMIDASFLTHETYATVAAVSGVEVISRYIRISAAVSVRVARSGRETRICRAA